jgi:predicted NAD-dependent protein-ADP-ribosyltransferase YbiA (DUF1768 family)
MKEIGFTKSKLPYGWMGNMSAFPIIFEGKEWRTTEALFQAMRFNDIDIKELIRAEKSPMGCKFKMKSIVKELEEKNQLHKRHIIPMSEADKANMEICVRVKIDQHLELKKMLIETGDAKIYEDVTKRGARGSNLFWGAMLVDGEWIGENVLGKIWEKLRNEIIKR